MANPETRGRVHDQRGRARHFGLARRRCRHLRYVHERADDDLPVSARQGPAVSVGSASSWSGRSWRAATWCVDDVDAGWSGGAQFTPALTKRAVVMLRPLSGSRRAGRRGEPRRRRGGSRDRPGPARGFASRCTRVTSIVEAKAERAIKPESIALGVFGAIAALAALLIAGQVIGRQLRLARRRLDVLRALGAEPGDDRDRRAHRRRRCRRRRIAAGRRRSRSALSPLAPLGPVAPSTRRRAIAFDWTVLGFGVAGADRVLGALALVLAYRRAPHRVARRRALVRRRVEARAGGGGSGLPRPAVTGIRFALEPGRGRNAVPGALGDRRAPRSPSSWSPRTLTFGASLNALVSHPPLYGWNWNYELSAGYGGNGDIPEQQVTHSSTTIADVAAWTGVYFAALQLDGLTVPVLGASPNAAVAPPCCPDTRSTRPTRSCSGPTTLAPAPQTRRRHRRGRQRVKQADTAAIVGTATHAHHRRRRQPAPDDGHRRAALRARSSPPRPERFGDTVTGPNAILVRLRTRREPDRRAPLAAADRRRNEHDRRTPASRSWPCNAPPRSSTTAPWAPPPRCLGAALAAGAVAALGLTLDRLGPPPPARPRAPQDARLHPPTARRHRRLAGHASPSRIGTIIGVPARHHHRPLALGPVRDAIHVVPQPTVSSLTITLIAVGALALANLVAAIPARQAARTRTAVLLHAE